MNIRMALIARLVLVVAALVSLVFLSMQIITTKAFLPAMMTGGVFLCGLIGGCIRYRAMKNEAMGKGVVEVAMPDEADSDSDDSPPSFAVGEPEAAYEIFEDVAEDYDVETELYAVPDALARRPHLRGGALVVAGEWAKAQDAPTLRARFGRLLSRLKNQALLRWQAALMPNLQTGCFIMGTLTALLVVFEGSGATWSLLAGLSLLAGSATVLPLYLRASTRALLDRAGYEAAGEWRASFFEHTQNDPADNSLTNVVRERFCADLHQ